MKRIMNIALAATVLIILTATPVLAFTGTATASANSGRAGGQKVGKISKKDRTNTGAMTVGTVKVNGHILVSGTDYNVRAGTDNSTRPVIDFTNPLGANAAVEISLTTAQDGTFTVDLKLE